MSWKYRVVHRVIGGVELFAIYEAYYDDAGNATMITATPTKPLGETLDELRDDTATYAAALVAPVLEWDDVVHEDDIDEDHALAAARREAEALRTALHHIEVTARTALVGEGRTLTSRLTGTTEALNTVYVAAQRALQAVDHASWFEREAYRQSQIVAVLRPAVEHARRAQYLVHDEERLEEHLRQALAEADALAQGEPPR